MIEIRTIRGPLPDEQLGWVTQLYGPVDPKYASLDFVRYQFNENPYGWSAHAFAIDDDAPVAHSCAVPFRARRNGKELVAGKIEAVVVGESHRGQRLPSGESIAVATLKAMYAFAHECGIPVLFGLAPPRVAAVHERAGCRRIEVDAPTYILFTHPLQASREWSLPRRAAAAALGMLQNVVAAIAFTIARLAARSSGRARLEAPRPQDVELGRVAESSEAWTVAGEDAWAWYTGSGLLRRLALDSGRGYEALALVPEDGSVQIVAWRPARAGSVVAAVLMLGEARRLARRGGAPTLRFHSWSDSHADALLARACRLLCFARRRTTELVVHADDTALLDARIQLTPFFYVTF
jgi:hypothetical protein